VQGIVAEDVEVFVAEGLHECAGPVQQGRGKRLEVVSTLPLLVHVMCE
jgi:hypothetical protein